MVATPAIELNHVTLNYREQPLFSDFSLRIPAGQCVCLLGQSGVGKSTLLKLIAGLDTHTDPYCSFSLTASDQQPIAGRISYMSQEDSLLSWLTVFDNLLLGYRLRKEAITAKLKAEAESLLRSIGLFDAANKYPAMLSCGMRQRVMLARTLLEHRPIILMDEPFSSLDIVNRYRLQDLMIELFRVHTILFVTHDPLEALRIGDVIYIIAGSPASLGTPIYPKGLPPRNPASEALLQAHASLLRELQANFLEIAPNE